MSYPRDLDEISSAELVAELGRRLRLESHGKCSYCAQPMTLARCRFPERHGDKDRISMVLIRAFEKEPTK